MDLITYLEENSNINRKFIDDFFGYYEYNNFYIDLENIIQWCKIEDKEIFRKEVIEKYKKEVNYIEQDNNIFVNGLTCKMIINNYDIKNDYYKLEYLVNKYNRYKIKKLKKRIRILKKSLQDSRIKYINNKEYNDKKTIEKINDNEENIEESINSFNNYMRWFIIGLIIGRLILICYTYFNICGKYNEENKCNSKFEIIGKIIKYIIIFVFLIKLFSLFCSSYLVLFIEKNGIMI
jgi:hypothetical protein